MEMDSNVAKWNCSKCATEFNYKKNLYAHERKFHNNKNPIFKCDKCASEFNYKKNLYVHKRNFHKIEKVVPKKNSVVKCTEYPAEFSYKKNLYVHERKFHNKKVPENPLKINKCDKCTAEFTLKRNLNAHTRKVHKQDCLKCRICQKMFISESNLQRHESLHKLIISKKSGNTEHSYAKPSRRKCRLLCPQESCVTRFSTYNNMRRHLMALHSIEIQKEEHEFTSLESFEKWKYNIEEKGMSCFSRDSSPKKLSADDEAWKLYYDCHRSYFYIPKGKDIRKPMDSNKIGKACPSRMEVSMVGELKQPSSIKVLYWKTHLGHGLHHVCLRSTRAEI